MQMSRQIIKPRDDWQTKVSSLGMNYHTVDGKVYWNESACYVFYEGMKRLKPMIHAKSSARKYGGNPEDYLDIHQFMDSSKASLADVRHRALLHSSFGCFIVEQIFGVERINSAGKAYSPRDVAEDHCIEDLGFIPSVERWLGNMKIQSWMGGPANKHEREKRKFIAMNDPEPEGQTKFRLSPPISVTEFDG